jgi:hypothetical protein
VNALLMRLDDMHILLLSARVGQCVGGCGLSMAGVVLSIGRLGLCKNAKASAVGWL